MKLNLNGFLSIVGALCLFWSCKMDESAVSNTLPSNIITKIVIDNLGVKWIATNNGLVSFDGKNWESHSSDVNLTDKRIPDLSFEHLTDKNQLWIATNEGVKKMSISGQLLTQINDYQQTSSGLLSDTVLRVASDNNTISYIGTNKGLSILKNNSWTTFLGNWGTKKDSFLLKKTITGIAIAKNGWNYVSTLGGGVSRFKYADAVTGATKFFKPWANGLKTDTIFTVVIVNDTCQWYGTSKGAAFHSSHHTKADWTSYSRIDGLVSDSVYAIAQDLTGTMWFGTQLGVSRLSNAVWTSLTIKDGLVDNKVNTVAVDIDGSLWFGTDNGLSHLKEGVWTSFRKK